MMMEKKQERGGGSFLSDFIVLQTPFFVSLFIKKLAWFDRELFLLLALCHKQELYIEPDLCDLTVMHLDLVAEIRIAGWSLEKKGTKVKFCLTLFAVFKTWNFPDAIYFFDSKCTLLYEMPSNSKGKNFVWKIYCFFPQNTMESICRR